MQNQENGNQSQMISVPLNKLTRAIKSLQEMFPNLNTAIIDRAILTAEGDVNIAIEKLLQVSSKFS